MDVVREGLLYREVAGSGFSLSEFQWREVKVRSVQGALSQAGNTILSAPTAGGFCYRDSGLLTSTCRNRYLLW